MADYVIGFEQRRPYSFVSLEVFTEKSDAEDFAEKYADGHGYIKLSRNQWRSPEDDGQRLVIFKRP